MIWAKPTALFVSVKLSGHVVQLFNHASAQSLIKEILIDNVYAIKQDAWPVKKVLDGGANIGLFAFYTFHAIPEASIICYEPDASNFSLLLQNTDAFATKIICMQKAIGLHAETKWLKQPEAVSLNKTFETSGTDMEVAFEAFENLLQQHFDLVKMDIEGAEWPLLQQVVEKKLLTTANYWMIELHDVAKHETVWNSMKELCRQHAYKIEKEASVWHLYKVKHT